MNILQAQRELQKRMENASSEQERLEAKKRLNDSLQSQLDVSKASLNLDKIQTELAILTNS